MLKTFQNTIKLIFFFTILECLLLFNFSCGLDTYEVFESPFEPDNKPTIINGDIVPEKNQFEFYTNEPSTPYSTITYLGTAVYYKVFNSLNECEREINDLNSLNSDSENSAKAADKMISITSSGYGFKLLKTSISSSASINDVTIPKKGKSQKVNIRLTDYFDIYPSKITVDDKNLNDNLQVVKPLRSSSSSFDVSFNFGRYDDEIPGGREIYITGDNGDDDIRVSTNTDVTDNIWYVAMFAVGVARDMNYSLQYSNIAYLGTVKIDASSENN